MLKHHLMCRSELLNRAVAAENSLLLYPGKEGEVEFQKIVSFPN